MGPTVFRFIFYPFTGWSKRHILMWFLFHLFGILHLSQGFFTGLSITITVPLFLLLFKVPFLFPTLGKGWISLGVRGALEQVHGSGERDFEGPS
jgi:hypothetical protein